MKRLTVELGEKSYDIVLDKGLLGRCGDEVGQVFAGKRVAVVTDTNVAKYHLDTVVQSLRKSGYEVTDFVLPAGEQTKSLDTLPKLYSYFIGSGITRSDLIVALGGGVIGDITGFAAATYLRGVRYVQMPTSLLAQVDSSSGGKVAADLPEGKNLVGAFYQPLRVIIDEDALDTLEPRFFTDGMGEVIKHACIRDKVLFDGLVNKTLSREDMLYTNCRIKSQVVEKDERDTGERMMLNFGHTIAHAVETYYNFERYSHGEAVAIGMYTITRLAEKKSLTKVGTADRIKAILEQYGLPHELPGADKGQIMKLMTRDKKNLDGVLNCILLREIGEAYIYKTDISFFEEL